MQPLSPRLMRTYSIIADKRGQRPASCAEVDCVNWRNGWITAIDPSWRNGDGTVTGEHQLAYLRADDRPHTEQTRGDVVVEFVYPPGVDCFHRHVTTDDRPELYVRRRGVPGRLTDPYIHRTPEDWAEDLAENQEKLDRLVD